MKEAGEMGIADKTEALKKALKYLRRQRDSAVLNKFCDLLHTYGIPLREQYCELEDILKKLEENEITMDENDDRRAVYFS